MMALVKEPGEAIAPGPGRKAQADFDPEWSYFDAARAAFGPAALDLRIGPIGMRLEGLSAAQAADLSGRYRPFVDAGGGAPHVTIALRGGEAGGYLQFRGEGSGETYRLESRQEGDRLVLWSYEFAGWVDPTRRLAGLDLAEAEGDLFRRGLENFLRVLTASFVLHEGGFLLHGCGVVRGGRAYIFFGPSGAGKTTVTLLSPGDMVLSDDLTLVVRDLEGRYRAAGIPFGMAHHRVPDTNGAFPIASFNRLVQSRKVRREPITGARAVAELAGSLPFVMQETRQAGLAMETIGRAIRDVPVHRLEFRRDASFWSVVEER